LLDPALLHTLLSQAEPLHTRVFALRLGQRLERWEHLNLLLAGAADLAAEVQATVVHDLERWLAAVKSGSYRPRAPTPAQRELASQRLTGLAPGLQQRLRQVLAEYGVGP
jgi:hypothetical protein